MKLKHSLTIALLLTMSLNSAYCDSSVLKGEQKVKLDNGLTVIIKQDNSVPIVSVHTWVKVGSINEDEKTSGLSHFLEHLIFKGTAKYPGQEISHIVETQGGVINAATSKEFTYFYIDTQKDGLTDAVSILADAMSEAAFPADEIDKERPVVIEEIMRHLDDPNATLYENFSKTLFLITPYKRSVIGSEEVIKNVSRNAIAAYYKKHYNPSNMCLVIVGDLNVEKTMELVKNTFGRQINGKTPEQPVIIEPLHSMQISKERKKLSMTYMLGGFLGPDVKSDEQFAADITGMILGGGRSSRLYMNLREKSQLVYSIGSSFSSQRGTGALMISALFAKENESKVLEQINKELKGLMDKGPTAKELDRAKEIIKSQWCFDNETCHDKASLFGYWELAERPDFSVNYLNNISKVTKKEVKDFLNKYYKTQGLSVSLIEPE